MTALEDMDRTDLIETVEGLQAELANARETLRDQFAGQALAGLLAYPGALMGNTTKSPDVTASLAYAFADQMLAQRKAAGASR